MIPAEPARIGSLTFREVESFPPIESIEHGQLFALSLSNNTTSLTHGLHRFPAKYIPQIPAWALDNFGSRSTVALDPFMGSGTTLVEGVLRGGTTIGTDVDPLARFIARAKVSTADAARIELLGRTIERAWQSPDSPLRSPMPDVENFGHWFRDDQWGWLQSLQRVILDLACSDEERHFLLAIFSSVLRWVSNADDQSQKTYVSGTLHKTPPRVQDVFWKNLRRGVSGLEDLNLKRHDDSTAVIPESASATDLQLADQSVDLAVTSPPYLDSVDYPYNTMLEYFWLGPHLGISSRAEFNRLRRQPIGARNPQERALLPEALNGLIELDYLPTARRTAASSYFALMKDHFAEMSRVLKDGARYVLVVGNSQTRTDVLPVHEALVQLAATEGFELERAFGYRIRRHYMKFPRAGRGGIILLDWVLVFKKGAARPDRCPLPSPWVTLAPSDVAH
jgi:DNA modification methylase